MMARKKNRGHFYSPENLPSYKPLSVALRFAIISIFSIVEITLLVFAIRGQGAQLKIPVQFYFIAIVIHIALTELQIILDILLERIFPVPKKLNIRLTIQLVIGIILIAFAVKVSSTMLERTVNNPQSHLAMSLSITIALFIVYAVANTLILMRLSDKWVDSQKNMDQLKQEKLLMDYNSLQDQLNPHFLFNNLSVLKSLIIYDTDTAVKFTEDFTDVYRYVLQSKNKMVVSLATELEFINAYIGLHKERLGDGLIVKFSINKECLHKEIAPLTLQLLVENAIKHNIGSEEEPLCVDIIAEDSFLVVSNNIQFKDSSYSTSTGLSNLRGRYNFLTDNEINVVQTDNIFRVQVPLI